jgi:hypothetical protein
MNLFSNRKLEGALGPKKISRCLPGCGRIPVVICRSFYSNRGLIHLEVGIFSKPSNSFFE